MRILTLGDGWTCGVGSSDPATQSWPAQLAKKYSVEVVNLAQPSNSNQAAARIGIEELCRRSDYDCVIFPLCPAETVEILNQAHWEQTLCEPQHNWTKINYTIQTAFYFIHSVYALGVPMYMSGLNLHPAQYQTELGWIMGNTTDLPLEEMNIDARLFAQTVKRIRGIHRANLKLQPEYLNDIMDTYLFAKETREKYGYSYQQFKQYPKDTDYLNNPDYVAENDFKFLGHPDDRGYTALADYFAEKIGLTSNT